MSIGNTVIGNGPIKIMVFSGWMGDSTVFNPTLSFWNQDLFTIAFVDYRGYGKSKDISGEYNIDEIASDGLVLADELGWNEFNLIGHSMAGMVIQKMALTVPNRIKSAVALTPVPASGFPMDEENTALFQGAVENNENRKQILDFTTGLRLADGWLVEMVKASKENTTPKAFGCYLNSWSGDSFYEQLDGLETPFLVAVGEHDLGITKEAMEQTYGTWLKNCEITVIGNAGHYPMQETPAYLVRLVEDYFSKTNKVS